MRERHRQIVENPRLLDHLFEQPIISVVMVQNYLKCSYPTANKLVEQYVDWGLLREIIRKPAESPLSHPLPPGETRST